MPALVQNTSRTNRIKFLKRFQYYNHPGGAFRCYPKPLGTVFTKSYSFPKTKVIVRTPGKPKSHPALKKRLQARPQKREPVGILKRRTTSKPRKKKVTFAKKRRTYGKRISQEGDPVERKFVEADDGTLVAVPRKRGKIRIV